MEASYCDVTRRARRLTSAAAAPIVGARPPSFVPAKGPHVDDARFDALVRALAPGASRRRALAGLAGTVLAALGPVAPGWDVAAKKRRKKRKKKRRCTQTCAAAKPCGPDGCGGTCVCDA